VSQGTNPPVPQKNKGRGQAWWLTLMIPATQKVRSITVWDQPRAKHKTIWKTN
jgi:hypothetical protein